MQNDINLGAKATHCGKTTNADNAKHTATKKTQMLSLELLPARVLQMVGAYLNNETLLNLSNMSPNLKYHVFDDYFWEKIVKQRYARLIAVIPYRPSPSYREAAIIRTLEQSNYRHVLENIFYYHKEKTNFEMNKKREFMTFAESAVYEKKDLQDILLNPNSTLTSLSLSGDRLNEESAMALSRALSTNCPLKKLLLNSCSKKVPIGMRVIFEALKTNRWLQTLDLAKTYIYPEDVKMLAQALVTNKSLQSLILDTVGLNDEGAQHLAATLKNHNRTLAYLDIGSNRLTSASLVAFAEAVAVNHALRHLDFCFAGYLDSKAGASWEHALKENTSLDCLSFRFAIGDAGAQCIAKGLAVNRTLRRLDIYTSTRAGYESMVHDEGMTAISNALTNNYTLTEVDYNWKNVYGENALPHLSAQLNRNKNIQNDFLTVAKKGDLDKLIQLHQRGVSINAENSNKSTALHLAATGGHKLVIDYLINNNIWQEKVNAQGQSALDIALKKYTDMDDIIALLETNGDCVNTKPGDLAKYQPLKDSKDLKQEAIDLQQLQISKQDFFNAAKEGNLAQFKKLILNDSLDINTIDDQGNTALHFAVQYGQEAIISYSLFRRGANKVIQNHHGETASFLANKQKMLYKEIMDKLGMPRIQTAEKFGHFFTQSTQSETQPPIIILEDGGNNSVDKSTTI